MSILQPVKINDHRLTGRTRGCDIALPVAVLLLTVSCLIPRPASAAQIAEESAQAQPAKSATPLSQLVKEAEQNNPQILAARREWQAATQVPSQVSTLPDPQITVQQLAVGSPRPFAGFSNNDFAYIGVGVSQDLPYPGKLRLRGEIAHSKADILRQQSDVVRRSVVEQVKTAYFHLGYVLQALSILEKDEKLLDQVEKIAESRYRTGQGSQQDVLKAQLQQTKILRDATQYRQQMQTLQAQMKQLLNRPQNSADIITEKLTETPLPYSSDDLLAAVRTGNPEVGAQHEMVQDRSLQEELARKDFYPDFNLQYMWQHTGAPFRDYYMATLGVTLPIFRSRRQRPEVAEAAEQLNGARRAYEAQVQQTYFEVRDQYLVADSDAKVLKIYREGLMPQARATFQAGLASYQSAQQDFETLLSSFEDVLNLDIEYWRTLAEHESALARLEQLTGIQIP